MISDSGIYLINPRGPKLRPLDLDKRRINKVAKVNEDFIKFGKSERPLWDRHRDYKKIFGDDVKFVPVVIMNNQVKLRSFESYISPLFDEYKISNPNSSRKLEWLKGISFEDAEKKILDALKNFEQNN